MPNLDYDPKNPTDLLDRPIAVGDIVAWGTTYGRSAALCIAKIDSFLFQAEIPGSYGSWEEVPQHLAERYRLRLEPIKSTGSITDSTWVYDPLTNTGENVKLPKVKLKTVQHVKNVVKLEAI